MNKLSLFLQSRSARVIAGFLQAGLILVMTGICGMEITAHFIVEMLFALFMIRLAMMGMDATAEKISSNFHQNHDERSILMTLRQSHRIVLISSVCISIIWYFLAPILSAVMFEIADGIVLRCLIPLVLILPHYFISRAVHKGMGRKKAVFRQDLYGLILCLIGWFVVGSFSSKLSQTMTEILLVMVPLAASVVLMIADYYMYQDRQSMFLQRARSQRTRPMSRKKIRRMLCFDDLFPAFVSLLHYVPFIVLAIVVFSQSRAIGYSLFQAQAIYYYTFTYGIGIILICRSFLPLDSGRKESRSVIERTFTVVMYMMVPVCLFLWQCTSLFEVDVALASTIRFSLITGFVYVWMVYFTKALQRQGEYIVIGYLLAGLVTMSVLTIWMYDLCGFEGGFLCVTIGCFISVFLSIIKLQYRNPLNWVSLVSSIVRIVLSALCANGALVIWKYVSAYMKLVVADGIVLACAILVFTALYLFCGKYMKLHQLLGIYKNQSWKDVLFGKEVRG